MLKSDEDILVSWQPEIERIAQKMFPYDEEIQLEVVQEMNVSLIRHFHNKKLKTKGLKLNAAKCDAIDKLRSNYDYFSYKKNKNYQMIYDYKGLAYNININEHLKKIDLERAIDTLNPREKIMINLLLAGYTQKEISMLYDLTECWISKIFTEIRGKLMLALGQTDEIHNNDNSDIAI